MLILSKQLELKLAHLSTKPGVYQFKDKSGGIIYIGKAKSLRNRVRSYFQQSRKVDAKLSRLVSRIHDLEVIVTDSEVEALILEANLVKEHKPRYNINLKDDKSFPYIRVTNERFPRIFPTRKIIRDGSQYFGPYTDVQSMRMLLKTIKRIFAVRTCNYDLVQEKIDQGKFKLCLNYHIKRCYGPCEGLIDEKEYNNVIAYVINFIKGHTKQIEHDIRDHIAELAAQLRFEEAARLRDQLNFIEIFQQKQKVVDQSLTDRDLLAVSTEADDSCCVVFKIRDGRIIARQHYYLNGVQDETKEAVVTAFLKQYYLKNEEIPGEVMLPVEIGDEIKTINTWLLLKRNAEIKFSHPVRGAKAHLLKMCEKKCQVVTG